ncbi:monovalent cation/H(+) antiporter subunit G [bacterium]|nr:monovalent cation/H(+) antiporter subunit G [bacterium]
MVILAIILIGLGLVFFTGGVVGILRFPDYYSRLHPAGMLDTMGLVLCMSGLAVYVLDDVCLASVLTAMKIFLVLIFVFLTSPTATHAIVDAGVRAGLEPWTKQRKEDQP